MSIIYRNIGIEIELTAIESMGRQTLGLSVVADGIRWIFWHLSDQFRSFRPFWNMNFVDTVHTCIFVLILKRNFPINIILIAVKRKRLETFVQVASAVADLASLNLEIFSWKKHFFNNCEIWTLLKKLFPILSTAKKIR